MFRIALHMRYIDSIMFDLQNNGGVVINITATLSIRGRFLQTHAGSAKAAIGKNSAPEMNYLYLLYTS